jgi:hypothetical protein
MCVAPRGYEDHPTSGGGDVSGHPVPVRDSEWRWVLKINDIDTVIITHDDHDDVLV